SFIKTSSSTCKNQPLFSTTLCLHCRFASYRMANNTGNLSNGNFFSNDGMMKQKQKYLPKRIILVRHGESEGNEDETVLEYVPNYKIKLSKKGSHQAQMTGS
ncbi:hypothetical protein Pfo_027243, partial [Paulownia fortunei]